ncbi:hypothetical protein WR25_27076 [Diploscapter pachys]|uniref:Uncharacterized protein n=1 Tax=Diploscapter pachys TaxID=2018661 RepID=A0A2A2KMX7_9BILA|nr:hypothetical protein WR25_27076 [Diploscapter pachys]
MRRSPARMKLTRDSDELAERFSRWLQQLLESLRHSRQRSSENNSSWIPGKSPSKRRKLFAKSPSLSPIKSPRKPLQTHNKIIANVETLLLPTPTKTERVLPSFEDESAKIQSGRKKLLLPDVGTPSEHDEKPVKKGVKRKAEDGPSTSGQLKSKKNTKKKSDDSNYVKINMRKKSFVRGKMSVEQKRKFAKKQKWKKKFGGKK